MFRAYSNYWDFQGRASRSEYWLFFLWMFIVGVVAGVVDVIAFPNHGLIGPCALFATFANLIPNVSLSFRRLHDTNRSARWLLIALIPIIGPMVLFVFTLMRGTSGENRFGPEPGQRAYEELEASFA